MDLSKLPNLWEHPINFDPYDRVSLAQQNDQLRRALWAITREHVHTRKELEVARDMLGYYRRPLPFLRLPREVRDQIYAYALKAKGDVRTEDRSIRELYLEDVPWKPSAPNLCLINKQIYRESVEVLYGKNTFSFDKPRDLLWFEEQIGSANRDLVQRIGVLVDLEHKIILQDADLVAPCDWSTAPAYWAKTLMKSRFKNIVEIRISNDALGHWNRDTSPTTSSLYRAIDDVFRRNNRTMPPRMTLRGVAVEDRHRFPEHWQLKFEHWDVPDNSEYFEDLSRHDGVEVVGSFKN